MYEGEKFTIGGTDYVVPALSMKSLRTFSEDGTLKMLGSLGGDPTPEQVDAAIRVIHAAFARNYPIAPEAIADMVDMRTLQPLISAIFGRSGLEKVPSGESPSP